MVIEQFPLQPAFLRGRRVLILRAEQQAQDMMDVFSRWGADVVSMPLLAFEPLAAGYKQCTLSFLEAKTLFIFTSSNGVEHFIAAVIQNGIDVVSLLEGKKIMAIGPATQKTLQKHGVLNVAIPSRHDSEGILLALPVELAQERILIPTALVTRNVLEQGLINRNADVHMLRLYKTVCPPIPKQMFIQDDDVVVFTSPSMATHFFESGLYHQQKLVALCIGPHTKQQVDRYLSEQVYEMRHPMDLGNSPSLT